MDTWVGIMSSIVPRPWLVETVRLVGPQMLNIKGFRELEKSVAKMGTARGLLVWPGAKTPCHGGRVIGARQGGAVGGGVSSPPGPASHDRELQAEDGVVGACIALEHARAVDRHSAEPRHRCGQSGVVRR